MNTNTMNMNTSTTNTTKQMTDCHRHRVFESITVYCSLCVYIFCKTAEYL